MSVWSKIAGNIIYLPGCLLIAGIIFYYLFTALNSYEMPQRRGTAIVVNKNFCANRTDHLPNGVIHLEPDTYSLQLRVEDREDEFVVSKDIYDSVNPNDKVQVTYTRLRLTNGISVTSVIR